MKLSIKVSVFLLIVIISVVLVFTYKINAQPQRNFKEGSYRLAITDSMLIKGNTHYSKILYRNNHLYNCMPFNFEVYDMNGKLLHHYTGQTTSCPTPKLRSKIPQRIFNFGEEGNKMFIWDDFGDSFFMYENHNLVRKIKTPLARKDNYALQNNLNDLYLLDSLHLLASVIHHEVESGQRSIMPKDPVFVKVNIKTGETTYFGIWDSLYYRLEPASVYCEDNENLSEEEKNKKSVVNRTRCVKYQYIKKQNILYYIEKASHTLKIIDFTKNQTFAKPLNKNLPILPAQCSAWENMSIYYDEVSNLFIRVLECYDDRKFYKSHQKFPIQKLLEIYDLSTNQLVTQIILPDHFHYFVHATSNLEEIWFEKNRLPYEKNTVLYKTKLIPES